MARRGSTKARSVKQEEAIAKLYGGQRSPSSGAAETDQGDVRTPWSLIECKVTGNPAKEDAPTPRIVKWMEKIAEEAWEEGKAPALALRYFAPQSRFADQEGWVDLIVRLPEDDVARERAADWAPR